MKISIHKSHFLIVHNFVDKDKVKFYTLNNSEMFYSKIPCKGTFFKNTCKQSAAILCLLVKGNAPVTFKYIDTRDNDWLLMVMPH